MHDFIMKDRVPSITIDNDEQFLTHFTPAAIHRLLHDSSPLIRSWFAGRISEIAVDPSAPAGLLADACKELKAVATGDPDEEVCAAATAALASIGGHHDRAQRRQEQIQRDQARHGLQEE